MSQGDSPRHDRQAQPRLHPRQPALPRQDLTKSRRASVDRTPALRQLSEEGYVAVTGVLTSEQIAEIVAGCETGLAEAAATNDLDVSDHNARGTLHFGRLRERVPAVTAVLDHPEVLEMVQSVIGPHAIAGDASYRCPRPGYGEQKLHADAVPLTRADGPWLGVTGIAALCDFTEENGATGIVPGSHRRPDLQRFSGSLDSHEREIVLTGAAGTVFVFNKHVLHRGRKNLTNQPRPALQISWKPAVAG